MDSKLLYPNFHAEVHRYKAASASNSLKSKQQPTQSSRATTGSGPRPNSSSSGSGHSKETSRGNGYSARPSSSPQKFVIQNSSSNVNQQIGPTRRRVLPPCVPTASATSKYAATGAGDYVQQPLRVTAKPDHQQAFTRQKSFSRIQDSDPDDESADDDCNSMSDDAETPELYHTSSSNPLAQMTTQRSIASSSFSSTRKPPSRQTAIRGELDLVVPMDNEDLVLSEEAASSGSTAPSSARRSSNTFSPHPSSRATTPTNVSSAASRFSSAAGADGGDGASPLLQSSSKNLQELVFNARPRSRYARREHSRQSGRTLDRLLPATATVPSLASSSSSSTLSSATSAPTISTTSSSSSSLHREPHGLLRNKSAPVLLANIRHSLATDSARTDEDSNPFDTLANAHNAPSDKVLPSPWGDADLSSFFLTELDSKAVEMQWKLARCIAKGTFLLYGTCEFQKAAGQLAEALELATGDDSLTALLYHHIGVALKEDGKLQWAQSMQEKALVTAQRAREIRIHGRALKALGVLFMDTGEPAKALDHQQEALVIALNEKDAELEARVYANLGNIASLQMQFGHALSCHKRDLRLSTSRPHAQSAVGQLRAHRNLALVYEKLNKCDLQREHEQHAAHFTNITAFVEDMRTQTLSGIGNIYMQLTKRDPKLESMMATSISDIVSEQLSNNDSQNLMTVAVPSVQVKQVLITRASDHLKPPSRATLLNNSSSLKRLG